MKKLSVVTILTLLSFNILASDYKCEGGSEKAVKCTVQFTGNLYAVSPKVLGNVQCSENGKIILSETLVNFDREMDTISQSLMMSLDSGIYIPDEVNPSKYVEYTAAFYYEINEHTSGRITLHSKLRYFNAGNNKIKNMKLKCQEKR